MFAQEGIQPIPLGGIAKDNSGPVIIGLVVYKLPYWSEGRPSILQVVLGDNVSVHTIFGTPFHHAAHLAYIPHANSVSSSLSGVSFPIAFKKTDPVDCTPAIGNPTVLQLQYLTVNGLQFQPFAASSWLADRRYLINMSQFHLHYRIEPKEVKPWELDLWDIIIIHRVLIRITGSRLHILNEKGSWHGVKMNQNK